MNDAHLIDELGGPAKVAGLLGYGQGGVQRVHNWRERGIPSKVKLDRPDLFGQQAIARLERSRRATDTKGA